jgi:hypothetical protein
MSQRGITFLMYHELEMLGRPLCQFDAGYSRYVVRDAEFRSQTRWLQQAGWRAMSVSEALALGAANGEERASVVVTFDDGCESDHGRCADFAGSGIQRHVLRNHRLPGRVPAYESSSTQRAKVFGI